MKRTIALIALLAISTIAWAQKPLLESQEEVQEFMNQALAQLSQDEKFLKDVDKAGISGEYTVRMTMRDKGKVQSVRALSRGENATIPGQNYLLSLLRDQKFKFKVPKGNHYDIDYTFRFE